MKKTIDTLQTSVTIPRELYKKLQYKKIETGKPIKTLILEAIEKNLN